MTCQHMGVETSGPIPGICCKRGIFLRDTFDPLADIFMTVQSVRKAAGLRELGGLIRLTLRACALKRRWSIDSEKRANQKCKLVITPVIVDSSLHLTSQIGLL